MRKRYFILFLFIASLIYWAINPSYEIPIIETREAILEQIDSTVTVSFGSVGDIMCHSTQYNYAWVEKDSFNFDPVFSVIGDYLREKDVLIGNLETVLAGETKKYFGYPFFNSPNQLALSLKRAGFNYLTTANNHANDQGFRGVKRTLEFLRKININPLGTSSLDSIQNQNLFVKNGLRFGLLSYTYGTNQNDKSTSPRKYVNYIDTVMIRNDIEELRGRDAEVIIVLYHFGKQYQKNISKYQKKIVDKTIEYGADVIIGSHPHIIQPFEQFTSSKSEVDTGFVVYSLGNFVSNQRWRYSDGGAIFNFEITKNIFSDSVYVSDISFLPIWVFKGYTEKGKDFIILPSANYENNVKEYMTQADSDSMKKSYFDTIELLTAKSKIPRIDFLKYN